MKDNFPTGDDLDFQGDILNLQAVTPAVLGVKSLFGFRKTHKGSN